MSEMSSINMTVCIVVAFCYVLGIKCNVISVKMQWFVCIIFPQSSHNFHQKDNRVTRKPQIIYVASLWTSFLLLALPFLLQHSIISLHHSLA